MGIFSIEWIEDVNLSGGSAAVALGLAAGRRGPYTASTVDLAIGPPTEGCRIVGAIACTETAPIAAGSFSVAELQRSPYSIGGIDATLGPQALWGLDIKLPPRATLGFNGLAGGAGEQSANALYIEDPSMADPWNFSGGQSWDEMLSVRPTTAARVLNTVSGHTDICGRTTTWTDAQTAIPPSSGTTIQVIEVESTDVAGYSGIVLEKPGTANLFLPCAAANSAVYDMMEIFGGYPTCTADAPFNVAGVGVTTAAMTLSRLTLGINYGR